MRNLAIRISRRRPLYVSPLAGATNGRDEKKVVGLLLILRMKRGCGWCEVVQAKVSVLYTHRVVAKVNQKFTPSY